MNVVPNPPAAHRSWHAVVLGGTRGLGLELAREARRRGHPTLVYGRSAEALREPGLRAERIDLTDRASVAAADVSFPRPVYLFWVAGAFLKRPLADTDPARIDALTELMWRGPVELLRRMLAGDRPGPLHLVTVASSSSWRARQDETLYCGLKAAQAAFTRALVPELLRADPRNRVTLAQPGGMATPGFHADLDLTPEEFGQLMDPGRVARLLWQLVTDQQAPFREVQVLRGTATGDRTEPRLVWGPQAPEPPELDMLTAAPRPGGGHRARP